MELSSRSLSAYKSTNPLGHMSRCVMCDMSDNSTIKVFLLMHFQDDLQFYQTGGLGPGTSLNKPN